MTPRHGWASKTKEGRAFGKAHFLLDGVPACDEALKAKGYQGFRCGWVPYEFGQKCALCMRVLGADEART